MHFEIVGEITSVETFAPGRGIRELSRLKKIYGKGRWRKRKGIALVRLPDGSLHRAEIHWYESTGRGKKELKIKRFLD
ncbi:MAG: hypothetical protein JRI59_09610 [Deltaproteobacteria bacterium]|nr:hypothetical protein [Deltaproteobacteria bacterium]